MAGPLFIVIEGIDGAGTTTHAARLVEALKRSGEPVHATREPSDGPVGVLLRQVLTGRLALPNGGTQVPSWATMGLLFAADRMDHLNAEVGPQLAQGVTVVSDRYDYSSVAYQGVTSKGAVSDCVGWLREINRHARRPDLTIVLDVPADVARARRLKRSGGDDIYDDDALQRELASFYREIEQHFPGDPIVHVDGNRGLQEVADEVFSLAQAAREKA